MKERVILHCDLNNFYASVECVLNPALKNVPIAVCGSPDKRHGVVVAKNDLAKKAGVKTGDVVWQALKKEPNLVFVPPSFDVYSKYSNQVFEIYTKYTSRVEPFGPDECWLDCTGSTKLFGSGKQIADDIRERVKKETGLTVSVGVSFNKIFAKLGSDLKKPDGTTEIYRENFKEKIWSLPCSELFMVGRKTTELLNKLNIKTIGQLANADENLLKQHFGINGIKMQQNALGKDFEEVREYVDKHENKSIGHGMTSIRDITNYEDAEVLIKYLADKVAYRLRKSNSRGYGVHLNLRSSDLSHISKQKLLSYPICTEKDISKCAIELMCEMWKCDYTLRTISISVYDLVKSDENIQLSLFDTVNHQKNERLENAIDQIRKKHGKDKLINASLLCQDFIYYKDDDEDFLPFKR